MPEKNLPRFFWKHLEKDLNWISNTLGCSIDDAVLKVHLFLKQLLEIPPTNLGMSFFNFHIKSEIHAFNVSVYRLQ